MDENLALAYKIVDKRFSKDEKNYGIYVLGCYGLLSKFGDEYSPLIEDFFSECEFYVDDKPLSQLTAQANFEVDNDDDITKVALSCNGHSFSVENNTIEYEVIPKKIFCCTSNNDNNDILNCFIHEGSHIIKSYVNAIKEYDDKKKLTIRCGIALHDFYFVNDELYAEEHNIMLDEVINVFQTTDMMMKIRDLDVNLLDDAVLKFYNTLNLDTMQAHLGYEFYVFLTEKLWENEKFKSLIEKNILTGDVEGVALEFDQVTGRDNSFYDMAYCLDYIGFEEDDDRIYELSNFVQDTIGLYNEKSYFGDVKNKKTKS